MGPGPRSPGQCGRVAHGGGVGAAPGPRAQAWANVRVSVCEHVFVCVEVGISNFRTSNYLGLHPFTLNPMLDYVISTQITLTLIN